MDVLKREMYEEIGALKIRVTSICVYKISTFGLLCFCEILEVGELLKDYEMLEVLLSNDLPDNLTYSDTYKLYFETVKRKMDF